MARVSNYVTSYWMDGITKEDVRLRHNLVGNDGDGVEGTGKANELMHVLIQSLLAKSQGFSADIFTAEVRGKTVNDY